MTLTTMLVMTTIFISKMEGLPSTSDPKMIDFWLILCQLVPFAEVVLLTSMEYLREDNSDDKSVTYKNPDICIKCFMKEEPVSTRKDTIDEENHQQENYMSPQSTAAEKKIFSARSLKIVGKFLSKNLIFV